MAKARINFYSDHRGQATIEAVLLMTLLLGVFLASANQLRDKKVVQNLADKSLKTVKHMAEYGSWKDECKPAKGSGRANAAKCHPNSIVRSLSSDPK